MFIYLKQFSSAFIYLLIKLQSLYFKQIPRSITKDNTYCARAAAITGNESISNGGLNPSVNHGIHYLSEMFVVSTYIIGVKFRKLK